MMRKGFLKKRLIKSGMAIALSAVMSVNAFGAQQIDTFFGTLLKASFENGVYGEDGFIIDDKGTPEHRAFQNIEKIGNTVYITARYDTVEREEIVIETVNGVEKKSKKRIKDNKVDDLAIMKFEIGEDNVARYTGEIMTIIDGGHGESLDSFVYNKVRYFIVGVKAVDGDNYFASQVAFVPFEANGKMSYKDCSRIIYFNYVVGADWKAVRTAASAEGNNLNVRVQFRRNGSNKFYYGKYNINKVLKACIGKKGVDAKDLKDFVVWKESGSNTGMKGWTSFQGMESYGKSIYISSGKGKKGETQKVSISKYKFTDGNLKFDDRGIFDGKIEDKLRNKTIDIDKCETEGMCICDDVIYVLLVYTLKEGVKYSYVVPIGRF